MAKKNNNPPSPPTGGNEGQRVGLRYIGAGDYFPGIPRRDLNESDLVRYAAAIAEVEAAGTLATLYEPVMQAEEEEASNG